MATARRNRSRRKWRLEGNEVNPASRLSQVRYQRRSLTPGQRAARSINQAISVPVVVHSLLISIHTGGTLAPGTNLGRDPVRRKPPIRERLTRLDGYGRRSHRWGRLRLWLGGGAGVNGGLPGLIFLFLFRSQFPSLARTLNPYWDRYRKFLQQVQTCHN